jgi:hypothetical protein
MMLQLRCANEHTTQRWQDGCVQANTDLAIFNTQVFLDIQERATDESQVVPEEEPAHGGEERHEPQGLVAAAEIRRAAATAAHFHTEGATANSRRLEAHSHYLLFSAVLSSRRSNRVLEYTLQHVLIRGV